jgi:hypothetical protein
MVTESTKRIVEAAVGADPTATGEEKARLLAALNSAKTRRLGTVRKAAEILQAHPRTVARYAAQGRVTVIRQSKRRLRYDLDECETLANQGIG